jgi:threonine dehydrogenase-like Zn-dependent dehydrogenase
LSLIESDRTRVKELITHRFKLEETAEAFAAALEGKKTLKVVVHN